MVVDDSADTRLGLREVLERDGYAVFDTGDGREALRHLRHGPKPDAILLDLYMPGLDGFEIYQVMRQDPELAIVPIIVVTGATPSERTGLRVKATIRKPIDVEELRLTVRHVINREGATPPR